MAFDGIMTKALKEELSFLLTDARISKIAQPEKEELLFTLKGKEGNYKLLISASASLPLLYITDENKQSPLTAPNFCMLLRKHISNAKIISITQPGLERIIDFEIEHLDELGDLRIKHLIVELMGKHSNIIFTDDNNRILDAIKHVPPTVSSVRTVLPGGTYFIPKTQNKLEAFDVTKEEMKERIKDTDTLGSFITSNFTGFSYQLVSEFLYHEGFSSDDFISSLDEKERNHYFDSFLSFVNDIKENKFSLEISYVNGTPESFSAMPLHSFKNIEDAEILSFDSASTLLRTYYKERNIVTNMRQRTADLRKVIQTHLERASRKLDLQKKQLKDTEKRESYKLYGELLNAYSYSLPVGEPVVKVFNYYDNTEIEIHVDPDLSISDNAKKFFEKYTKQKRTYAALSDLIIETESEVNHLLSIMASLDLAKDPEDLTEIRQEMADFGYIKRSETLRNGKKVKPLSKPYHYISSDGFDIYVGRNNFQNDMLTFKFADGNDYFFHAKKAPGSHVILKTNGKELPDRVFEEAGALAAYYSSARMQGKVEIDYVEKKQVKKPAGAKPGFVVYYTNYSLIAEPDISMLKEVK